MDKKMYQYPYNMQEPHSNFLGGFGDWVEDIFTVSPEERAAREARRAEREEKRRAKQEGKTAEKEVQQIILSDQRVDYKDSIMGACQRLGISSINKPKSGAESTTEFVLKVPLKPDVRIGDIIYLLSSDQHYTGLFYITDIRNDALGRKAIITIDVPYKVPSADFQGGFATTGCIETEGAIEAEGALRTMPDMEARVQRQKTTQSWLIGGAIVIGVIVSGVVIYKLVSTPRAAITK